MKPYFWIFLALLCFTACSDTPQEKTLKISGSNTIGEHLMPQLAKAFLESRGVTIQFFQQNTVKGVLNNTFYTISIQTNGSKNGITDLNKGKTDIAMISESQLLADWKGDTLRLASDTIAIVTHRYNPILTLDTHQIKAIFSGKIKMWQELTPQYFGTINVHIRDSLSGTYSAFQQLVLQDSPYSLTAKHHASNSDLFDDIRRDYYGIGYISSSELTNNDYFKLIPVKNTPFNRPLFLLSPKENSTDLTQPFFEFCRSETARSIIESLNFKFQ